MRAKTAKQAAAQERFRAAAKQAKREGKKGKSYARRVGELLRGRASHGGGHKTKSAHRAAPSHHSSGGGSMAAHKPKPRMAVYLGLGASALVAAGEIRNQDNLASLRANAKTGSLIPAIANNLGGITTNAGTAARTAAPAVIGAVASLLADKLGVNRVLAKARSPVRI